MNWTSLLNEMLKPLIRRAGTAVGSALTATGLAADDVQTLVASVPLVVGLVVDLGQSYVNRNRR